jgi:three-Cys-motif partner protein
MSDLIKLRPTQTRVKHDILERYLRSWGGIIINGLAAKAQRVASRGRTFDLHFVYVDCNASVGRFLGEIGETPGTPSPSKVFGSPIIGVRSLDDLARTALARGINLRTNAILIEKKSQEFRELQQSLDMAGLGPRVRQTNDFSGLQNGEIAVLRADSTMLTQELIAYTQTGYTFSLYFLDPYGPLAIPLPYVRDIITQPRHDVIINMPYQDLHKKAGSVTKLHPTPAEVEILQNYDDMYGSTGWRQFAAGDIDEFGLVNYYRQILSATDADLAVKSIPLHFPTKERTMFHLFLTTHDCDGALRMNEILDKAGYLEHTLRWELKQHNKRGTQLLLSPDFDVPAPPLQTPIRATPEEIADQIYRQFRGKTVTLKKICSFLADEDYFHAEVKNAIAYLKKTGRATYGRDLNNDTQIQIS